MAEKIPFKILAKAFEMLPEPEDVNVTMKQIVRLRSNVELVFEVHCFESRGRRHLEWVYIP